MNANLSTMLIPAFGTKYAYIRMPKNGFYISNKTKHRNYGKKAKHYSIA